MAVYVRHPHTTISPGPTGCGKTHLVLVLIDKEYNNYFDYIIFICPTLRWNKTYHSRDWIKHEDKVWLIEPKGKLYQWIEKLSQLLACSETFIIDDIIADQSLDKKRESLLELAISCRHVTTIYGCWHNLILPYQIIWEDKPRPYLCGILRKDQILKW